VRDSAAHAATTAVYRTNLDGAVEAQEHVCVEQVHILLPLAGVGAKDAAGQALPLLKAEVGRVLAPLLEVLPCASSNASENDRLSQGIAWHVGIF
jgi:hypothetical protein